MSCDPAGTIAPTEPAAASKIGVDQAVAELLVQWRAQDAQAVQVVIPPLSRGRVGIGIAALLRSLVSRRRLRA